MNWKKLLKPNWKNLILSVFILILVPWPWFSVIVFSGGGCEPGLPCSTPVVSGLYNSLIQMTFGYHFQIDNYIIFIAELLGYFIISYLISVSLFTLIKK